MKIQTLVFLLLPLAFATRASAQYQGICPPGKGAALLMAQGNKPDQPPGQAAKPEATPMPPQEGEPVQPLPPQSEEDKDRLGQAIVDHLGSGAILGHILVHGVLDKNKPPNIVVIMADDIGIWNLSCYHNGMLGGSTPNIDRIRKEGAIFTDFYTQQSCTAGRSTFITGQSPLRSGLLKVGLPGAPEGLQDETPTMAQMLKDKGYQTVQFGKNHLGDLNKFLPTLHGFDAWYFGSCYHLNALEEPFETDYPKDPKFYETVGPRGLMNAEAAKIDNSKEDKRWGVIGKQKIEDLGPLAPDPDHMTTAFGQKANYDMTTVDRQMTDKVVEYIKKASNDRAPFFAWINPTRMHIWTNLKDYDPKKGSGWSGKTGYGLYADGMAELDTYVGEILDAIDKSGEADNTIVVFTTDNGAELFMIPDGGITPFHGEKGTTWEGGFRSPLVIRWPGVIPPGSTINDVIALEDFVPTFLAAAGDSKIKQKLLDGYKIGDTKFRSHLDGYNFLPYFAALAQKRGKEVETPRKEFWYFSDNGDLNALRYGDIKISFATMHGNFMTGQLETANVPFICNLRADPFEQMQHESADYGRWWARHAFYVVPAVGMVQQFMATFGAKQYPPAQAGGSFKPMLEEAVSSMQADVEKMSHGRGVND